MADANETCAEVIAKMRRIKYNGEECTVKWCLTEWADLFDAAYKREKDNVHHAMVILAGIEMEDSENPPRLWTALEDAYDALSDALGTDGDTTADEEEAKATGRHFVIPSPGDAEELCKALVAIKALTEPHAHEFSELGTVYRTVKAVLKGGGDAD